MLAFATDAELRQAMDALARWLPDLVDGFKHGIEALGCTVTKCVLSRSPDGTVCPQIHVTGKQRTYEVGLRNSMEDFLLVDRDAQPPQLDPELTDVAYARSKLADVVDGRLALLRAIEESADPEEMQARVTQLGDRFARLRIGRIDQTGDA